MDVNRPTDRVLTGKFRNDQDIGLTLFVMPESAHSFIFYL